MSSSEVKEKHRPECARGALDLFGSFPGFTTQVRMKGYPRWQPNHDECLTALPPQGRHNPGNAVKDEILHHFETMKNHYLLVFTGESPFQGFLGGAGFCPSTACMLIFVELCRYFACPVISYREWDCQVKEEGDQLEQPLGFGPSAESCILYLNGQRMP